VAFIIIRDAEIVKGITKIELRPEIKSTIGKVDIEMIPSIILSWKVAMSKSVRTVNKDIRNFGLI
jgi:hypothetical protein